MLRLEESPVEEFISANAGLDFSPAICAVLPDENKFWTEVNSPTTISVVAWWSRQASQPQLEFASSWLVAGVYFLSFCYTV